MRGSIDYTYSCPHCRTEFCGEVEDTEELRKEEQCEECGQNFNLKVDVRVEVVTEATR